MERGLREINEAEVYSAINMAEAIGFLFGVVFSAMLVGAYLIGKSDKKGG